MTAGGLQQWASLADFLAMGGHGPFVWGSYALAVLCVLLEPWWARRRWRKAVDHARHAQETSAP